MTESQRIEALAQHLELTGDEWNEVTVSSYDGTLLEYGQQEYLVLTDEESDNRVVEYIRETIWAFRPGFLARHSVMSFDFYVAIEVFEALQEKCEDSNDTVLALIKDFDALVADAVDADKRGHFLSCYDGEENDAAHGLFIYRTN
jgi:hypothetical protein